MKLSAVGKTARKRKNHGKKWTEEDYKVLQRERKNGLEAAARKLGREESSVKNRKLPSDAEWKINHDELVGRHFHNNVPVRQTARMLNRNISDVIKRQEHLGLVDWL